jgi:hypothetical protein
MHVQWRSASRDTGRDLMHGPVTVENVAWATCGVATCAKAALAGSALSLVHTSDTVP